MEGADNVFFFDVDEVRVTLGGGCRKDCRALRRGSLAAALRPGQYGHLGHAV